MSAPVHAPPATEPPQLVWTRLARLVAAPGRGRMRLCDPATGKFTDTAKRTDALPSRPAALYLYTKSRTRVLALDFDAKHFGAAAVDADLAAAASWITACGGVVVTDRSTSGGRHLLCPLAIGTSASVAEIVHLVRLMAARLPTLDITPNTGASHGCITPPGSPCREGGFRQLDGPLDAAVEAFTTRSAPDLLPRLSMLLGALRPTPAARTDSSGSAASPADYTVGVGDDTRLAPGYVRDDPLPAAVEDYARRAVVSPDRPTWRSNHEARMSVVTHATARGHSLDSLRAMIAAGGPWHEGLGRAYRRYQHRAEDALARDHAKALDWLIRNVLDSHPPRHKSKYSPGGHPGGPRGPRDLRAWLANALAWADQEFKTKRYRWTVHAVLQALAFHAVVAGELRSGTWLVGVGGRTLSLATGLLSEDTVWRVLQDLREHLGSPIVLARAHVGLEPDTYALTMHNRVCTDPGRVERIRVEPVHEAWFVLGHHLRRVYELIAYHGLTCKADIYAAAAVTRSAGDNMVMDLEVSGLITRTGRGTVAPGPVSLDDVAARHRLEELRAERITRYRTQRAAWKDWLRERDRRRGDSGLAVVDNNQSQSVVAPAVVSDHEYADWLTSVMATGPPDGDELDWEAEVIEMTAELLGARILTP